MSSPFSKKNLPFTIFAVLAVLVVLVLVSNPFKSGFGEGLFEEVEKYYTPNTSDPVYLTLNSMQSRVQNVTYGRPYIVSNATEILDNVIASAVTLDPKYSSGSLKNLYLQAKNTLEQTLQFRSKINTNTSPIEILVKANILSYPVELLMANSASNSVPS